jgi:hypothetical protein
MSKLFDEMTQGTAEARAYMEGKRKGYKITLPDWVIVRGLRKPDASSLSPSVTRKRGPTAPKKLLEDTLCNKGTASAGPIK